MGAKCCCGAGCLKLDYTTKFADALNKVKEAKDLKGLCLTYPGKKLDQEAFKFFDEIFSTVKGITCLRWDLNKCDIDENEVKQITAALVKQPQLQSIFIDFSNNQLKSQGVAVVKEAFAVFKDVKKVNVVLANNGVDAEEDKKNAEFFNAFNKVPVAPAQPSADANAGKKDFEERRKKGNEFAERIFNLTNEFRLQNSLEKLEWNPKSAEVAFTYAKELAFKSKKYIFESTHSAWDARCKALGVSNETARENLGLKLKLQEDDVGCIVEAWKKYQKNYDNLLFKEAKHSGVAVYIFDDDDDDSFFEDAKDAVANTTKKVLSFCQKKKEPAQRQLKYYFVQIIHA